MTDLAAPATPRVDSHLLGTLTVTPEQVFTFPEGILGFPEAREFVLVPDQREGLFWLQSLEHGALTFLLADPFETVEDFEIDLSEGDLRGWIDGGEPQLAILGIVTLPREPGQAPTLNLQGPLVFEYGSMRARQVILPESPWGIHWPVDLRAGARMAS